MRPGEVIPIALILLCAALAILAANESLPGGSDETGGTNAILSLPAGGWDLAATSSDQEQAFGAGSNPTGSPIGGGDGYLDIAVLPDPGTDSIVTTTDELLAALLSAKSGDLIYIDEMARIDLTDTSGGVTIPGGVTLASNRGERSGVGSATYSFTIEEPGDYFIWVLSSASGEESDPFRVSVDEEGTYQWDLGTDANWHWNRGGPHYLSDGQHNLTIHWRGNISRIDEILMTRDADYLPDSSVQEQSGEGVIRMEAESGVLSPLMEITRDPTASGGAYISITDSLDGGEYPPSPGGMIVLGSTDSKRPVGLIAGGEHVRITGIRLEGPDTGTDKAARPALGIYSSYRNLEVDNCEIWGWSGAAIGIAGTGGSDMKTGGHIHHNYIHHCQMRGLGYGVVVSGGAVSLIEANYFDYCRHAIAGSGVAGDGYEARYNICGPNFIAGSSHNFDMHGVATDSGTIAGDTIRIHHNTFTATGPLNAFPVAIRGVPRDGAYIDHNWFYYDQAPPVWQTGGNGNIFVTDNLIGQNETLSASGPIKYY